MGPEDFDLMICDEDSEALVDAFLALTRLMVGGMVCAGLILAGALRRRR